MIVLVFPKSFEFFKFLNFFMIDQRYIVNALERHDMHEYYMHISVVDDKRLETYKFKILLIDDSDINFYGIFAKLAGSKDKKKKKRVCPEHLHTQEEDYVLIGAYDISFSSKTPVNPSELNAFLVPDNLS